MAVALSFTHWFIPTCVGNTPLQCLARVIWSVHPHVCGEHASFRCRECGAVGSSPRVWGTLGARNTHSRKSRFIPTCVGNTGIRWLERLVVAVHPHVCGEHPKHPHDQGSTGGSSPRVWGTRQDWRASGWPNRFIPTCVGNTLFGTQAVSSASVHPHVCGEHFAVPSVLQAAAGSSPRVWGTHPLHS